MIIMRPMHVFPSKHHAVMLHKFSQLSAALTEKRIIGYILRIFHLCRSMHYIDLSSQHTAHSQSRCKNFQCVGILPRRTGKQLSLKLTVERMDRIHLYIAFYPLKLPTELLFIFTEAGKEHLSAINTILCKKFQCLLGI